MWKIPGQKQDAHFDSWNLTSLNDSAGLQVQCFELRNQRWRRENLQKELMTDNAYNMGTKDVWKWKSIAVSITHK